VPTKKETPEAKPVTVEVAAKVYPPRTMFFRQACGKAERDGKTWELTTNIGGGGHPIVRLPDGRWVTFNWTDLIEAANEAGKQRRLGCFTSSRKTTRRRGPCW
jgi:hypothetical protein